MKTPDITPVQAKSGVASLVVILSLLGVDVGTDVSDALVVIVVAALALVHSVLLVSDAIIRAARAKNADVIAEAQAIAAEVPPVSSTAPSGVGPDGFLTVQG